MRPSVIVVVVLALAATAWLLLGDDEPSWVAAEDPSDAPDEKLR